jgi:hypothetical protein
MRIVLSVGVEIWTVTKKDKYNVETAEIPFLRSIAGVSTHDRKRNTGTCKERIWCQYFK